ncbi:copper chaperone PCu(A)C [Pseudoroseicyclus tamaricis]|uniref:Copper chaperone PCu(A)C n=1 Tax=Pseudoroseicyclus tamaricis TaxID=2705421 RepID=A0A6B2JTP1_9RHOB|nr:copper chaperone PCu(A)C [Pseudoroseicyclus tamaricis]NDU99543.1 copper chaperone PCu(A)C [Pseudoroseicyclus tamaricis]
MRLALAALTLLATPALADPELAEGYVTAPYAGASAAAAYLTIRNPDGEDLRLTGVSTPAAAEMMLHETVEEDGVVSMRPLGEMPVVPAGGELAMAPGAVHLMLTDLDPTLEEGALLPFLLLFEGGATLTADLPLDLPPYEHGAMMGMGE